MKRYTLNQIKKWAKESVSYGPTGNKFIDDKYDHYTNLVGHINPYYRLFHKLAQELKPSFVLELGSYRATASGHFAIGNPDSQVVTIDMHKDPEQAGDKQACILADQTIPNLTYINKCTVDNLSEYGVECALSDVKAYKKKIDILFIDAWHAEKYVKREWELYSPLLANNALVICDDILDNNGIFPGMEKWWDDFPYQKFLTDVIHPGIPMGFFIYKTALPKRKK